MAEMTTLLAAIYRRYTTAEYDQQRGVSPGITSRFEVFYDESLPCEVSRYIPSINRRILILQQEHECWVNFNKREN
jgi:hypothetical protein